MSIKKMSYDNNGISNISISGYKSIVKETSLEIRPLTIIAGSNSSGKSSFIQPLLLLKQTLEASYDPGPLLINGPNVKFTAVDQVLSSTKKIKVDSFSIEISIDDVKLKNYFVKAKSKRLTIDKTEYSSKKEHVTLSIDMNQKELFEFMPKFYKDNFKDDFKKGKIELGVERERCFFNIAIKVATDRPYLAGIVVKPSNDIEPHILKIIHLPGLRGNPERTYPVTAVGSTFPGTFEPYVASVVAQWQEEGRDNLKELSTDLERLGLTWKVTAVRISDTQVELKVGRLTHAARGGAQDLVSIADVGFGVSQTLPVLVALRVAEPGQLVYLEQPEIHLHPRAQAIMAEIILEAINRGVRVVVETHSSILLLSLQALIAEGKTPANKVKLHWFARNKDGATSVSSTDLDDAGSFGDWPEDFGEVSLNVESRYLDAAEIKRKAEFDAN